VKILLVEHSKILRLTHERAPWSRRGYEVVSTEDGEQAPPCAKEQKPSLILLDLLLPNIPGLEVLTRRKHNRDTAKTPVIAVSGLSEKSHQRLVEAGAEDYLEKNSVIRDNRRNRLPKILEEVIGRIKRKRGVPFSPVLEKKTW
jgi:DNA-binding response OmpR family regulator